MEYLIGIDIGTSGIKSIIIDRNGKVLGSKTAELRLSIPKPIWAEQNPEDWWNGTGDTLREVIKETNVNPEDIKGIGLSGQMHSLVIIDKNKKVLRPAILWCDNRTTPQREWITEKVGLENLKRLVSNPPLEGFTAPKIIWVRDNEPHIYEKIDKILLAKDYIRFHLTGEIATEVSDAAGTVLFDVKKREWSEDILNLLDIPKEYLPPCFESIDVIGRINKETSELTGLKKGTPVVGGGADNPCAAVGNGIVREGRVQSSIGTSGTVVAHIDSVKVDPDMRVHTFCHTVPEKWYLMGVVLQAGGSLRWFRDTLGKEEIEIAKSEGTDPYDLLCQKAEKVPIGADGLIFLPYLSGERTPHQDGRARGALVGLTLTHQREHLIRAVFEGITFAMRDSIEIMRELGVEVSQVRATGGGAKNSFWIKMQADVFNTEVVTISSGEGPAFGAALLAGTGAGIYSDVAEAADEIIKPVETCEPDPANSKIYEEFYNIFKETYPSLKDIYSKIP